MANYAYHVIPASVTISAPQAPLNASAFTLGAPNLVDNAAGDTTTYDQLLGSGANGAVYGLIDLQTTQYVASLQFTNGGSTVSNGVDVELYSSTDGTTWTRSTASGLSFNASPGSASNVPLAINTRYLQLIFAGATGAAISDIRVYGAPGNSSPYTIVPFCRRHFRPRRQRRQLAQRLPASERFPSIRRL